MPPLFAENYIKTAPRFYVLSAVFVSIKLNISDNFKVHQHHCLYVRRRYFIESCSNTTNVHRGLLLARNKTHGHILYFRSKTTLPSIIIS